MRPGESPIQGTQSDFVHLLGAVASVANETTDIETAVQLALEHVASFTGWPWGQAFHVDPSGDAHAWLSWHGADPRLTIFETATAQSSLPRGVGLPGRVAESARPAWITDVGRASNFPRAQAARDAGLHGAFAFPISAEGSVVAVLEFLSDQPVEPDTEFLDAVEQVGMHLGRVFERQHAHAAISLAATRLRQILDSAGDAFIGMDSAGRISEWNREAQSVFGWTREEAIGRPVADTIVPEEYRELHAKGLQRFLSSGQSKVLGQRLELAGQRSDGVVFPLELTLWALREGDAWSFYSFARDITARKEAEAELARDALHDALTGLANRTALNTQLEQALSRMTRGLTPPAVLFIDLDRFKPINDSLGHDAGDKVLVTVAERLLELCRTHDLVARLAGDEFVVLLDEAPTARDATLVASRIVESLGTPVELAGQPVRLSASVGVALARPDSTPESLLRDADAAMYQAKAAGRGRFDIYGEGLRERVTSRLSRESELAKAIDEDRLAVAYQPVFALDDLHVSGVEALLRWNHPELGQLAPGEFIDIAEESGLIIPIGAWVLDRSCRQLQEWRECPHVPERLQMAVNLSARQLALPDLADRVSATVAAAGLAGTDLQLCLEVTESVVMHDPQAAAKTMSELRRLGVMIAIDDFGTGYSSLAYLKWFPVDIVKIDRSFIASVGSNNTDRAIVKAVVGLTRELGLRVVAEGVETPEQLAKVTELGCTHAQGFLLARPQPAEEFLQRLADDRFGVAPIGKCASPS